MHEFHEVVPTGVAEVFPPGARTYVSVDIDVLDLPLIPECVSAEPNGMTYAQLRDTLAAIAGHCDVIGLDLVEVSPTLDVGTGITSYLAPHTVLEFLGNIFRQLRWECRRAAARRQPNGGGASPSVYFTCARLTVLDHAPSGWRIIDSRVSQLGLDCDTRSGQCSIGHERCGFP